MLVFIGSIALNPLLPPDKRRKLGDIDAIADYTHASNFLKNAGCVSIYPINKGKTLYGRNRQGLHYEVEIAWPGTTAASFLEKYQAEYAPFPRDTPLDILYMFKMSHRYLRNSPHFHKTRNDILMMRELGAKIPEGWEEWYKQRRKDTYWYQHPNLDRTKDEFFVDQYQYDHDSIHEAVAIDKLPAYTHFNIEGKEVLCSKEKFFACDEKIRLNAVVEESMVLALERSLIPHAGKKTEEEAFTFALTKVCTSITSGWFREYAWENYDKALNLFNFEHIRFPLMTRLYHGISNGTIKVNPAWVENENRSRLESGNVES